MTMPTTALGASSQADARLERRRQRLGQADHGDQGDEQKPRLTERGGSRAAARARPGRTPCRPAENSRGGARSGRRRRSRRARARPRRRRSSCDVVKTGPGVVVVTFGHDQRQPGKRAEHGERGTRARDLETLLVMMRAAHQQAQPDDAVAHDHDGGEHRVAGQRRAAGRPDHHRDDQRHLDDGDGDGEQQRAERLADPMRHDLGVIDGGKDRGDQQEAGRRGDRTSRTQHHRQYQHGPPARATSSSTMGSVGSLPCRSYIVIRFEWESVWSSSGKGNGRGSWDGRAGGACRPGRSFGIVFATVSRVGMPPGAHGARRARALAKHRSPAHEQRRERRRPLHLCLRCAAGLDLAVQLHVGRIQHRCRRVPPDLGGACPHAAAGAGDRLVFRQGRRGRGRGEPGLPTCRA